MRRYSVFPAAFARSSYGTSHYHSGRLLLGRLRTKPIASLPRQGLASGSESAKKKARAFQIKTAVGAAVVHDPEKRWNISLRVLRPGERPSAGASVFQGTLSSHSSSLP